MNKSVMIGLFCLLVLAFSVLSSSLLPVLELPSLLNNQSQAFAATFVDVPESHWAWQHVESIYQAGITAGCSSGPLKYCPDNTVTRAQMAIFLLRGMHGSAYVPPAVGADTGFDDVPVTHWAAAWIKQLAAEGITSGCGVGLYCPEQTVTRAEMAVFLLRAEHGSAYSPPLASGTVFSDVPITHPQAAWIEQLANEGITGGCGNNNYCPASPVTRAQMAVLLVMTFDIPLFIPPTPTSTMTLSPTPVTLSPTPSSTITKSPTPVTMSPTPSSTVTKSPTPVTLSPTPSSTITPSPTRTPFKGGLFLDEKVVQS